MDGLCACHSCVFCVCLCLCWCPRLGGADGVLRWPLCSLVCAGGGALVLWLLADGSVGCKLHTRATGRDIYIANKQEEKPIMFAKTQKPGGAVSCMEKWGRTLTVWTDATEQKLYYSKTKQTTGPGVMERYLYYYSYTDVEYLLTHVFLPRPTVQLTTLGTIVRFNKTYLMRAVHVTSTVPTTIAKTHLLFMGVIHAREPASLNVNLAYLDQLSLNLDDAFRDVLDQSITHFILLANPCGYELDQSQTLRQTNTRELYNHPGRMYRKNGYHEPPFNTPEIVLKYNLGVDLNRNFGAIPDYVPAIYRMDLTLPATTLAETYDIDLETVRALQSLPDSAAQLRSLRKQAMWGVDDVGSSPSPVAETYRGPRQNSEDETQLIAKFMLEHPLAAQVMHHTYGNKILHANRPRVVKGRAYISTFTHRHAAECERMATQAAVVGDFPDELQTCLRSDRLTYSLGDDSIGYPVNGDMNDFGYLAHSFRGLSDVPFISVTAESGNVKADQFYPSVTEMIDIVANGVAYNSRLHQYLCRQHTTKAHLRQTISRILEAVLRTSETRHGAR